MVCAFDETAVVLLCLAVLFCVLNDKPIKGHVNLHENSYKGGKGK